MRLDKFLKVSRIIKRRTVANEACSGGRVQINDKVAKPGNTVKVGDIISIQFGNSLKRFEVLDLVENAQKDQASSLYREL
ncbi:MAG: RNA-binding S4 domain-containing protein [Caldicoprobacterales bacterium]|jgi:ribosomal 50S subunit-recycling heat shock protein|nr:RNA-binding S4 domain-containing protein [Clostridia bacterium]MDI9512561.1 RNA-binding S4 domain-containing protein [Bacillota bacterium]